MTAFLDASVVIAILAREHDWVERSIRLDEEEELLWSAVSRWESITGLRRKRDWTMSQARDVVDDFGADKQIKMVVIAHVEAAAAVEAAARYGRASGHPAKLNMGDCFAYACAKANGARLLYKGDDFIHTDLA